LAENRSEGPFNALVRSGGFVEAIRNEADRRRDWNVRARLQDGLQDVREVLEVAGLTEVRLVSGVGELNAVAAVEVVDQITERVAVLDRDLLRVKRRADEDCAQKKYATVSHAANCT